MDPSERTHIKPRIRIENNGSVPSKEIKIENPHRFRNHKSRIRRLDPKNLNAGPDLQLYARVPIQNEVPDSKNSNYRYKTRYRIQKIQITDTKRGTGFKKFKLPIQNEVPDS